MAFLIRKRRSKCTMCTFSSRSVLNPKNRARQWCLGLDSGDSGYVFDVKWFERLPWLVNLRSPPNISVMILHLKLFGRYFPKQGPALVRVPNFEFHQKQSSIYELSDPAPNSCCKIFAGLHHFHNSGRTAWGLIEIWLISHINLA